ncbi:MAG: Gfo/Idh/MocA family oxidoreductase [Clostridia bacterium]|nr:Gfo/Idh/MocA family oxidoreductase [Clostridia bacterium]
MKNIALVGTWHVHFEGYANTIAQDERCRITALWDPDETAGKAAAEKYGCDFEPDYDKLLARQDVDAISVCTQTNLHPEIIMKAAKAGKHIFTEKVLCFDTKTASELAEAIKNAGIEFCISFVWRARGDFLWIKKVIDEGLLGELTYCRMRNAHNGAIAGWLPETFYDAESCGGGAMMDLGAHPMYLLNWFMGKPKAVSSTFTNYMVNSVEDNAVSVIEYENGAIGISETGFVAVHNPFSLEICGSKGSLFAGGPDDTVKYNVGDGWVTPEIPDGVKSPLCAWIDAINGGESVPYTIDDAVALTQTMEAAYVAHKENKKITL